MGEVRLGIDVACTAKHQASLAEGLPRVWLMLGQTRTPISEEEGREICATRYKIDPELRRKRSQRQADTKRAPHRSTARKAARENEESQSAPFPGPPNTKDTQAA